MTWRSSSRSKISPLHVTYVSIPSMSICFSCFTNCSTCSWLYGPKPPAPLPVQAAGPAEADPATPAGPVPPLLPVKAAGPTEVDPAAAGPVGRGAGGRGRGLGRWAGYGPGGRGGGLGQRVGAGGWGAQARRAGRGLGLGDGGAKISPLHVTYVSIPSMSMCFSCFTNCSTCSWLYGPKPPAQLPVQAAMPAEADPATPVGPVPPLLPVKAAGPTEVDPAAAGPVPVLPVEAAGGLLGAAGWGLGWG